MLVEHDNAHRKHIEKMEKAGKKENWGEDLNNHVVHMAPLVPFGGFHHGTPINGMSNFGNMMNDLINSITKPGKAPEHKRFPILPHSLFKPGPHPAHKKEDKKDDKKEDMHKDHSKVDKIETKPKSEPINKNQELKKPQKIN